MDRRQERLLVNSVHSEPAAPCEMGVSTKVRETIEQLAEFLGAREVEYTSSVPADWRNALH